MQKKCFFQQANLFIRSLAFYFFMAITTPIYSTVIILLFPFALRYRFVAVIGFTSINLWALKVLCRVNYRLEGIENIPRDRTGVVLSKH